MHLIIIDILFLISLNLGTIGSKTCSGVTEWNWYQYHLLRSALINCTIVSGSLVLYRLRSHHDLSFLSDLEEITGYLVISKVTRPTLALPGLKYIRGRETFKTPRDIGDHRGYALLVEANYPDDDEGGPEDAGLRYLEFPALVEISAGDVAFLDNPSMCYGDYGHISWKDIFAPTAPGYGVVKSTFHPRSSREAGGAYVRSVAPLSHCPSEMTCPWACSGGHVLYADGEIGTLPHAVPRCWSPGVCQTLTRTVCGDTCHPASRCTGPGPAQCCSPECLGLCTGPGDDQCSGQPACRNYRYIHYDTLNGMRVRGRGTCLRTCRGPTRYDPISRNSKVAEGSGLGASPPRLFHDHDCVVTCPPNHVIFEDTCLDDCPAHLGFREGEDGHCVPCEGDGCVATCSGVPLITPENIGTFENCTFVLGGLNFVRSTFGTSSGNERQLTQTDLDRYFGSVTTVSGYVRIEYLPGYIHSLSFLKALREIKGRTLAWPGDYSLFVKNTNLSYLGLASLRHVRAGRVYLSHNPSLCHVTDIDWNVLYGQAMAPSGPISGVSNHVVFDMSRDQLADLEARCSARALKCHAECRGGCWGPGAELCLSCSRYRLTTNGTCVAGCSGIDRTYPEPFTAGAPPSTGQSADRGECRPCHTECLNTCTGPGPGDCRLCRNYEYRNVCVPSCPPNSFEDGRRRCLPCHTSCFLGCSGPLDTLGRGGCEYCAYGGLLLRTNLTRCNAPNVTKCPDGFYANQTNYEVSANATTSVYVNYTTCVRCHEFCATCTDATTFCHVCKHTRSALFDRPGGAAAGECLLTCPEGTHHEAYHHFGTTERHDGTTGEMRCYPCSALCGGTGCRGPRPNDCTGRCARFKLLRPLIDLQLPQVNHSAADNISKSIHRYHVTDGALTFETGNDGPDATWTVTLLDTVTNSNSGKDIEFTCVDKCPTYLPFTVNLNISDKICVPFPSAHPLLQRLSKAGVSMPVLIACLVCALLIATLGALFSPAFNRNGKGCFLTSCRFGDPKGRGVARYYDSSHGVMGRMSSEVDELSQSTMYLRDADSSKVAMVRTNAHYVSLTSGAGMSRDRGPDGRSTDCYEAELGAINPSASSHNTLNVIKYEELSFGELLGFGAFGTVHKGIYCPQNSDAEPQVVAIKVVRDDNLINKAHDVFQEIALLASVRHPGLLAILGMCVSGEYLIVTEFVEGGSLLDFLRTHVNQLPSSTLVTWSSQVAEGMAYLESRCIVHRDLAARNVLVRSMSQVLISDFGSARILENYENIYKSSGGKMPFKWLAIESLNSLIFTHKSDVWAYGVTIWEIFTFGQHPYKGIQNAHLLKMLEEGKRLQRPNSCSLHIYKLILACWNKKPELRPSFTDLQRALAVFADYPDTYITPPPNDSNLLSSTQVPGDRSPDLLVNCDDDGITIWEDPFFRNIMVSTPSSTLPWYANASVSDERDPIAVICSNGTRIIPHPNYYNTKRDARSFDAYSDTPNIGTVSQMTTMKEPSRESYGSIQVIS